MREISGRTSDYLVRKDGSRVSGISMVEKTLTAIASLEQLQIIQAELQEFVLNAVVIVGEELHVEQALVSVIHEVFGDDARVSMNYVSKLDQTRSGKYRFAICNV